ncbi:MAG: glutaredoxin domain-containing protein [Negativicoccus succinicivorans]|nr:glutaredoxin domain-containing protein [Negativicoccus succinicivorans]
MLFIYYPKCSTCRRAKAWLDDNNIRYEERLIVEDPPTAKDLLRWSKKPISR